MKKTEKIENRPNWDQYFLKLAKVVSTRATCNRAKHGCVLVKDKTVLATGYNGAPPGISHCLDSGCILINGHCERCNHAEVNSICQAAAKGVCVEGATAYVTGESCLECLRTLLCAKIDKLVYIRGGHYSFPDEEQALRELFIERFDSVKPYTLTMLGEGK